MFCKEYSVVVRGVCEVVCSSVDTGVILLVLGGNCCDRGSTGLSKNVVLYTMLMERSYYNSDGDDVSSYRVQYFYFVWIVNCNLNCECR